MDMVPTNLAKSVNLLRYQLNIPTGLLMGILSIIEGYDLDALSSMSTLEFGLEI